MVEIKGLERLAPRDFPGLISATVFTGGCNFRCPYCHNPELVLRPGALSSFPLGEFLDFLDARDGWLEGICVTGGEPLLHEDLGELLGRIKQRGLRVKLDTNGAFPERLRRLILEGLTDFVAMDIKAPPGRYDEAAGVPVVIRNLEESIAVIRSSGCPHLFRTTVVPGLHSQEDIVRVAEWLGADSPFRLQPFVPGRTVDPAYSERPSLPLDDLQRLAEAVKPLIPGVTVEGI